MPFLSVHQSLYLKKKGRPKRERYFGEAIDRGQDYRPKYICLKCRRVIRVSRRGWNNQALGCGNCGGCIFPIGPMFKSPPANTRRGKKAWGKIEKSISVHTRFYAEKRFNIRKAKWKK